MTTQTSPNMNIVVPVPGSELGPAWAIELQTALLTIIDQHDHSSGKGVLIKPAGMSINADLPFGGFNATLLRTVRLALQAANPALGTDIGCLYEGPTGDLWYNDSSGAQIQLTASHAPKFTAGLVAPVTAQARTITATYTVDSITPDYDIYADTSGASYQVTLPSASTGRQLNIIDVKGTFGTNNLNIFAGASKINGIATAKILSSPWGIYAIKSNGTDWFVTGS